ncbi:Bromodomain containing protein, partial [Acanthamoeba castellanii str. Neff]
MDTQHLKEDLYRGLDDVLRSLKRADEDNVFVNRVNKRDAPNYYEVIARPMYLNLMTKKLKKGDYYSKAEFQGDIDLIVGNCRQYNTDPESIYRLKADQLEAHAAELLAAVPDIDLSHIRREGRRPPSLKGPGRPRKQKSDEDTPTSAAATPVLGTPVVSKRGPGRPRKSREGIAVA